MAKNTKITVLGGGLWGTVLAHQLARGGREVLLWEFFPQAAKSLHRERVHPHIPDFRLAEPVTVTSDLSQALSGAEVVLFVLPSSFVRTTARQAGRLLRRAAPPVVVNASKGIEPGSLLTMGEVIASELPRGTKVFTLSGPSFAREVAKGVLTKMVLAGPAGPAGRRVAKLLDGGILRIEESRDRKGVELGGSLKNVLAIGCGILDGMHAGANTKAALIAQGMAEMGNLIGSCGGRPETIYGLAGLGDLFATGTSHESRNRGLGEKLGAGKSLETALREIPTVVEGIEAAGSVHELARRRRVKAPLLEAIWSVLHRRKPAATVVGALGFKDA